MKAGALSQRKPGMENKTEALEIVQSQKKESRHSAGIDTGRYIPGEEFDALIEACLADDTHAGLLDRAMFARPIRRSRVSTRWPGSRSRILL